MADVKIEAILHKNARGEFEMFACRGTGKGCKRNKAREKKKPCDDCLGPLPDEMTLQQVHDRLTKGDA